MPDKNSLNDIFNKLKTTIVGTKTLDIDGKLDSAVSDITAYRTNIGRNGYIELVKNLISKNEFNVPTAFSQSTTTTPAALGQGTRLMRYKSYEAIVGNINYCHRALSVLTDNILAPDDITKTCLEINPVAYLETEKTIDSDVRNCKNLISKLKLENALNIIVRSTLHMGDFFCEIADAKTALTSKSAILTENENYFINNKKDQDLVITEGIINEDTSKESTKFKMILDYSSLDESDDTEEKDNGEPKKGSKDKRKKDIDLSDINLLYYDPKRVVKLQSDMYPICFGYLVFPQAIMNPALLIQNQMVNNICQNILSSLTKKIPSLNKDTVNATDLKDIISVMIKEADPSRTMNIRYVPPNKMQHFFVPSTKFYPYGESIFDSTMFTSKLLIALETALVIFRLNRSTEKRKISIEVGLPRDARKAIEKIKEEFRKRKVSIDTLGTVDTIPSQINTFEDVFLPAKDGKNYVDITSFGEGMVDTRGKVDEVKTLRDQLVASLGIPASFLNIEENLSNKAALGEESILFARTIVNNQKYLSQQIGDLIKKVYQIVDPEKALTILDNVTIAFPPPKSLQFERESKYLSDLANLVMTLESIGVPKEWSKKKYLTNIDWKEVEKFKIDSKIDKALGNTPTDGIDGTGGMGGMGPEFGGMGGGGTIPGGTSGMGF